MFEQMDINQIKAMVIDKIKFQWKTVAKAFNQINRDAA